MAIEWVDAAEMDPAEALDGNGNVARRMVNNRYVAAHFSLYLEKRAET